MNPGGALCRPLTLASPARRSEGQPWRERPPFSVTRQIEHAKQYTSRKGWNFDARYVFVDDGISGAEFANRPGFLRLMNALKPKPKFQILVMSEEAGSAAKRSRRRTRSSRS